MLSNIFNKYYIDNKYLEAAFEGISLQTKGWIKKTLAVCRNYYRPDFPTSYQSTVNQIEDTLITRSMEPCNCCVVLYPSEYAACTRALAAVAPGLFAGVDNFVAVGVHSSSSRENTEVKHNADFKNAGQAKYPDFAMNFNLLAAWEIAGVEDIAFLPEKDIPSVFNKLLKFAGKQTICLVILGDPIWEQELEIFSANVNIKIWQEKKPEFIHVQAEHKEAVQIIKNLHTDIEIKTSKTANLSARFVVGDECFRLEPDHPILGLDSEYAGCWIWPDLAMDFYYSHAAEIGL